MHTSPVSNSIIAQSTMLSHTKRGRLRLGALAILLALLGLGLWLALTGPTRAAGATLHVAPTGVDTSACGAVLAPCRTLQYAVGRASPGDEIRTASGVYTSTEAQVVRINKRLTLRGGFTTTNWLVADPIANPTIIDGENARRGILIDSNAEATIAGFHVRHGRLATANEPGAGIYNQLGNTTIEDCWIYNNLTQGGLSDFENVGGGIANGNNPNNRLVLRRNYIYANTASHAGGGVTSINGEILLERNTIYNNTARFGAGFSLDGGSGRLINNVIRNNNTTATGAGGGIAVDSDAIALELLHNTLYGNTAAQNAGGMFIMGGTIHITNTLFVNNSAPAAPATNRGAIVVAGGTLAVSHTDFHDNAPNHTQAELDAWGGNNRFQNPQFVNPAAGDFRLSATSPAIDTGADAPAVTEDALGYGRPFGAGWDRGAHEYTTSAPCYARVENGPVHTSAIAAVNAAPAGATVQVAGRCAGGVEIGKDLTLRGAYTVTDWSAFRYGPTTLDGQGTQRVLRIFDEASVAVENLHLTGGSASQGAALLVEAGAQLTARNLVVYQNLANDRGGGLYNNGAATVEFSTFYGNTATLGGAIYAERGMTLRNSAIVANSGSGVYRAPGIAVLADYNAYHANTPNDYGNLAPGANDLVAPPEFVNPAAGDFHLQLASPLINAADPAATLTYDFEGDPRPRGERADIGADERLFFAATSLTPPMQQVLREDLAELQGRTFTFTYTLKNTGYTANLTDTYDIAVVNEDGWPVAPQQIPGIGLRVNETRQIQVAVTVPLTVTPGFYNRTLITAQSRASVNAAATALAAIVNPGLIFTPDYAESADPGQLITYTHTLVNIGPPDTFTLTLTTSQGWGELFAPENPVVSLAPNQSLEVIVRVQTPRWAAAGVQDTTMVRATSQAFGTFADVSDVTTAKATTGDRYVRQGGLNTNNNCTQPDRACATPGHAVQQAASGDSILIAEGVYASSELLIDRPINLLAGYRYANGAFTQVEGNPDPTKTILTFGDATRAVRIEPAGGAGSGPLLRGFTIRAANAGAGDGGGVLLVGAASARLHDLRLENVRAARGGALYVAGGRAQLERVWIENAQAQVGGALYNAGGNVSVNRLTIQQSQATTGAGGAIYNAPSAVMQLHNGMIFDNSAAANGGALYNAGALTAWNNTLVNNQAGGLGGGLYDHNSAALTLRNTIFMSNTAGTAGGGLFRTNPTPPHHGYNAFWQNQAPLHPQRNIAPGVGDLDADPLFADPAAKNFRLTFDSPCVDTGDPATPLTEDFEGDVRPSNHGYDIGADELRGCLARVLEPGGDTQIGPLFYGVQQAVDFAPTGALIQVHGICFGVQPRLLAGATVSQTVYISKSLTLRGGYPATFEEDTFEETILDALGQGRVVVATNPTTDTLHVALARLTLRNGNGLDADGGVLLNDADVDLRLEATRLERGAAARGGALYNREGARLTLGNATFISSTALYGGALYNAGWTATISPTLFQANAAQTGGGALYNASEGQLTLNAATVLSNTTLNGHGGGLYNAATGALTLTNSLIVSNTVSGDGGGLYNLSGLAQVRHDTFYGNAAQRGAAIFHNAAAPGAVLNSSLLVGNQAQQYTLYSAGSAPTSAYNGFYGNTGGNANIPLGPHPLQADPLFLSFDPTSATFLRIPSGSPAEDRGDPDSPLLEDIDRKPRPSNQGFDIGASEVGDCYIRINGALPTYGNVQRAIRHSSDGDVLYIAGTCRGVNPVSFLGQTFTQTAFITKSLGFQGGFTVTNWTEPHPVSNTTTLDAAGLGRVAHIAASPVVTMSGLHLIGGAADQGGGIFMAGGVFTLTQSHVYSHTAASGGGFFLQNGAATLTGQNTFHHNTATQGGALHQASGSLTLDGNFLHDNSATRGGALYRAGGATDAHNTFVYRNAAQQGAGFYNAASATFRIRHNTFYANTATQGGALYTANTTPLVRNNIFAENTGAGHAIYSAVAGFNTPDYNGIHPVSGALVNTGPGAHDVLAPPGFVDAAADDFRLADDSEMLDRGDPNLGLYHDFEGDLRPADQGFDLGADERRSCWARIVRLSTTPPTVLGPFASPQLAIDASEPGDRIEITVGECRGVHPYPESGVTYYQTVHVPHPLHLKGGFLRDFSEEVEQPLDIAEPEQSTIFNATGAGRALLLGRTTAITVEQVNLIDGAGAAGGGPNRGGGLLVNSDAAQLHLVGLYHNQAENGGGLSLNGANQRLTLDSVRIYSNTAMLGGGAYLPSGAITLTGESLLSFNTATQHGGALYNFNGAATIAGADVQFKQNRAAQYGGALYNHNGTAEELRVTEAHFVGNSAQYGGAIYGALHSTLLVDRGARLYLNEANLGGAVYGGGNNFNVQNTLIYTNTATKGAAVYLGSSAGAPLVQHNTLVQNVAQQQGGAIFVEGGTGSPKLRNNIFDGNQAAAGSAIYAMVGELAHNNYYPEPVEAQVAGGVGVGMDNLNLPPGYAEPPNLDNPFQLPTANFHLDDNSPMIDRGLYVDVPHDMDGQPRPVNHAPDIGADEFPECLARVRSTMTLYGSIQAALDAADEDDTVDVAEGVCRESLQISRNVTLDGSWKKNFGGRTEFYPSSTVDARGLNTRVVMVQGGVTTEIIKMEFQNGNVSGDGGGLYVSGNADVTLSESQIWNSRATGNGGGVYNSANSIFRLWGSTVVSNTASLNGGGVYNAAGSEVVINGGGTSRNRAVNGGGIYNASTTFEFRNHGLVQNRATGNGGGFYNTVPNITPTNIRYVENEANTQGGGIYNLGNGMTLWHNTLYRNTASLGGGVYNTGATLNVKASIVANNAGGGIHSTQAATAWRTLRWGNIYTGITVQYELEAEPRLTWQGRLTHFSPAIDTVPSGESPIDIDALTNPRPQLCAKDMGSHEYTVGVRAFDWTVPEGVTLPPATIYTYTVALKNLSEEWRVFWDSRSSMGPGTGYTETLRVSWQSSRGWTQIVDVRNGANIITGTNQIIFDIGPGIMTELLLRVTIPPHQYASVDGDPRTYDTTTLSYETLGCRDTLQGQIGVIETRVAQDLSCALRPTDLSASARPGESVAYTHILTNTGNLTHTYTLVAAPGFYAAATVVSPTTLITQTLPGVRLSPGMSATVVMSVSVRPEIAAGLTDVATLIGSVAGVAQCTVADFTHVLPTTGIRYVALEGADSNVDETLGGNPENLPDNNCTQPQIAPCQTLRHALAQSQPGEEVRIAAGTYTGVYSVTQGSDTRTQLLYITHPLTITGGYLASAWDAAPPDHLAHPTVLDAENAGRAVYIATTGPVRLERLTLRDGAATDQGGGPGGADAGGNLYHAGATLHLNALRLSHGQAALGGGFYQAGGEALLTNVLIHQNAAGASGGGLYLGGGALTLRNNTFYLNTANAGGGAIYAAGDSLALHNTIIADTYSGGGTRQEHAAVHVAGGTVAADYNLYFNNSPADVLGFSKGAHDLSGLDPRFVAPTAAPPDLDLQQTSPAREKGDPNTPFALFPLGLDYANRARLMGLRIDIGAYEYLVEPSFELVPAYRYTVADPGAALAYTHTLRNTGEFTDTYTLAWSSSRDWITALNPAGSVELGPGAALTLTLTGAVPASGSAGLTDVAVITATSQMSAGAFRTARNETRAAFTPGVQLAPPTLTGYTDPALAYTYTYTVTNLGDGWDSYTLTVSAPPAGWLASVSPVTTPLLPPGGTTTVQASVTPPADALSGTSALVTVTATSSFDGATAANASALTHVNRVRGVRLESDQTQTITTATAVTYTHTLTNLGNYTDTFTLAYSSSAGWSGAFVQPPSLPATLGAGASTAVQFRLTVPPGSGGATDVSVITATVEGTALTATVVNTTQVTRVWDFSLQPGARTATATPGATLHFTHTLANLGNVADEYAFSLTSGPTGWATLAPASPLALNAGQSAVLTVTVTVPADAPAQTATFTLQAASQGNSETRTAVDTVQIVVGEEPITGLQAYNNSPTELGNPTALWATIATGTNVSFTWNFGDGSPPAEGQNVGHTYPAAGVYTAVVTASNNSPLGSAQASTVVTITAACAPPQITDLASDSPRPLGAPMHFTATVTGTAPFTYTWNFGGAGTAAGESTPTPTFTYDQAGDYTVALTVANACGQAQASLPVQVLPPVIVRGVTLAPNHEDAAFPDSVLVYRHTLTNTGNLTDTFELTWHSSQGWNAALAPEAITLGAGLSAPVTFTLTVPPEASANDVSVITAISRGDPTIFDTAINTTMVLLSSGAVLAPAEIEGRVDPGATITYRHTLTNTSVQTYTFALELQSTPAWIVAAQPAGDFVVGAGAAQPITVTVTAPTEALSGTIHTLVIGAHAQEAPEVVAYARDRTTVNQIFGVHLLPDTQRQGQPGETVVFTHTLMNLGNGADTFTLDRVAAPRAWPGTVTPPTAMLGPATTQTITVTATIPLTATPGMTTTVTVRATSQGDPSRMHSARTNIIVEAPPARMIYLPLVLRAYNPDLPDLVITGITLIPAAPAAGQTVTVRVTVQNQGPRPVAFGNNFYVDFYVNRQPQPLLPGELTWGAQGSWFGVGQSRTFEGTYIFSGGVHQLYAQVDTDNTVAESNEGNNVYGPQPLTVSGTLLQGAPVIEPPTPLREPRPTPTPQP